MTLVRSRVGAGSNYASNRQVVVLKSAAVLARFRDEGIDALPTDESAADREIITRPNPDVMIYDLTPLGAVGHSNWGAARYAPEGR
jgi:hypothetical protein